MKRIFAKKSAMLFIVIALLLTPISPLFLSHGQAQAAQSVQGKGTGRILKTYREATPQRDKQRGVDGERPEWVETALQRTLAHFKEVPGREGINDAQTELKLVGTDEDDLGQTHVRMDQVHNGVEVFGGQLITHLDKESLRTVSGRVFEEARVDTTPVLTAEQAIEAAKAAFGHKGEFAAEPTAKLVVLPHRIFKSEGEPVATLTYQVALPVEDDSEAAGHHQYFVDAREGVIVWHYDSLPHGIGRGQYTSQQVLDTVGSPTQLYFLIDPFRGRSTVRDLQNQLVGTGVDFVDTDDVWGNFNQSDRQTAAADAHYALARSWDYFAEAHGRNGADSRGTPVTTLVHWGANQDNANGSNNTIRLGDGGGVRYGSWATIDAVGHEFTHSVIQFNGSGGLIYAGESGAINESLCDIFGTAIEWYTKERFNVGTPDYQIFEDSYTPATAGDAARDMANPPAGRDWDNVFGVTPPDGDPDHYSRRFTGTADNGGVHTNSGIMNKVFYLLAVGNTHPVSGIYVPNIGRRFAERIFYRALLMYLTPGARFTDVRDATVQAAIDLATDGPWGYSVQAVRRAWEAVGVFEMTSAPAAVSSGPNRIDIFARGADGACWTKSWDGSRWSVWLPLGGEILGAPTVASWGANRLDVFVRGTNNCLYQNTWDGSRWSGWMFLDWGPLGSGLASSPAAVSWGPNRIDIFVRGTDNQVYQKFWDGYNWSGWVPMGGGTYDNPAVSSRGYNRLDLFVRGTNDLLYQKSFNGYSGGWSGWEPLGTPAPNVSLASGPAALGRGRYRVQVFVRGSDTACYGKDFEGFDWFSWYPLGGAIYGAPAAVSMASDRLDLFVRGTNNQLYQKFQIGYNWSGWIPLP